MAKLLRSQRRLYQQTLSHVKGLINVCICIKFEVDTTDGFLDIEANLNY